MIRVAIIDPQFAFRQLLRNYLESAGKDFVVIAESSSGEEALSLGEGRLVDLLMIDHAVTDRPAAEVIGRIVRRHPHVRVLLVAADYGPGVREAIDAGAHGCVLKTGSLADFDTAMRVVASGGSMFPPRDPVVRSRGLTRLTPRQQQTLELIAAGLSTKEVADRLQISFKTADHHRTRLMKKLNVHDVASLVRFAIRHGVAEL